MFWKNTPPLQESLGMEFWRWLQNVLNPAAHSLTFERSTDLVICAEGLDTVDG